MLDQPRHRILNKLPDRDTQILVLRYKPIGLSVNWLTEISWCRAKNIQFVILERDRATGRHQLKALRLTPKSSKC